MQEFHLGEMQFEGASERGASVLENNPKFEHSMRHKTVHNNDIYRLNAAISDFQDSLKETLMVHQAGNSENFIEALKLRTKSHFYVKEQKEQNPDFDKVYNSDDEKTETGQQVLSYIQFYKNNARLNEDQHTNKELQKIELEKKYMMPNKHKIKLELIKKLREQFNIQKELAEKIKKQLALQATKDNKPKVKKQKLPKLNLSNIAEKLNPMTTKTPNNRDLSTVDDDLKKELEVTTKLTAKQSSSKQKIMTSRLDKLLPKKPKFDTEQSLESRNAQILSMNIKQPFYQNDKKIKDTIKIGEKVFKREFRQDAKREGYSKLLKKINEADLTLRQIKNGQTLFDKDLMTIKYSNPYLQNDSMRQTLINYIDSQKPVIIGDPNLNIFDESVMQSQASVEIATTQWYKNTPDKRLKPETTPDSRADSLQKFNTFSRSNNTFNNRTEEKPDNSSKVEEFYNTRMGSVPVRIENIQHPFRMTQRNTSQPFSKKLEFPASPSFVNNYFMHKNIKIPKMTEVLAQKNVPFTFEEKNFYKIKQFKHRFNDYAHSISTCFETGKPSEFDVGIQMLKGTSNLPAQFVNSNYNDMQLYMPATADHAKTAKLQAQLRKNVKNAKQLSPDLPTGSVITKLVGAKPFQQVNQATIRSVFKESEKNKHTILQELHRKLENPLIVDTKPIDQRAVQLQAIQMQHKSKTSPKKRKDPIHKIFKVNNHAFNFSQLMNQKVLKILERYELDKPIMMQDKLDMIWDKPEGKVTKSLLSDPAVFANSATHTKSDFIAFDKPLTQSSESLNKSSHNDNADFQLVRQNLKTRKIERLTLNRIQIKAYEKLMKFLISQKVKDFKPQDLANPTYIRPEEALREFMDAFRIIIQSGYFIQEKDFMELMEILKVTDQAQTREQRVKIFTFFSFAASQLNFNSQKVKEILAQTWIDQEHD